MGWISEISTGSTAYLSIACAAGCATIRPQSRRLQRGRALHGQGLNLSLSQTHFSQANGAQLMANISTKRSTRLDDLPNIGKSIAADLRSLGVVSAEQLAKMDSMETYQTLASVMGRRHDPCVLYTLRTYALTAL